MRTYHREVKAEVTVKVSPTLLKDAKLQAKACETTLPAFLAEIIEAFVADRRLQVSGH